MTKRTRKMKAEFQIADVRKYATAVETTPGLGPSAVATILKDHGDGARDLDNLHPRHYDAVARGLIDVLTDFDHTVKLRQENPWQLSVDHPRFVEATDALAAAWQQARRLGNRYEACEHMRKEFEKYKAVGATGRGTRSELYAKLNERFPRLS
jgi:hypothetical protein